MNKTYNSKQLKEAIYKISQEISRIDNQRGLTAYELDSYRRKRGELVSELEALESFYASSQGRNALAAMDKLAQEREENVRAMEAAQILGTRGKAVREMKQAVDNLLANANVLAIGFSYADIKHAAYRFLSSDMHTKDDNGRKVFDYNLKDGRVLRVTQLSSGGYAITESSDIGESI